MKCMKIRLDTSKRQLGNGSFKRFVPALPTIQMDYTGIYKILKALLTREAIHCSLVINIFVCLFVFFSVMFIRPSSFLPSVDVCAGQTSWVSLCLRAGNFPAPNGVPGLSCSYPACQLHKSLTCHPVIHSLTHWKRNWGGGTRMDKCTVIDCRAVSASIRGMLLSNMEHDDGEHLTW